MSRPRLSSRVQAAVAATCFALCASVALAQGKSGAGDDGSPEYERTLSCSLIGCNDGNRLCGTVSAETTTWIYLGPFFPPIPWSFTQAYTCYETVAWR